jgi:hypothetical protein
MRLTLFAVALLLPGQETSQSYRYDLNGRRVPAPIQTVERTPSGFRKTETTRSVNGRTVPLESAEENVIHKDANSRTLERIVRKYDPDGRPGAVEKVRIEERKNPDGTTVVRTNVYRADVNGHLELAERSTTRAGASESTVVVERPAPGRGMEVVERETVAHTGSRAETRTYRRDSNGNFYEAAREVSETSRSDGQETTETTRLEAGNAGRLEPASRTVSKTQKRADGSETEEIEVYSKFLSGHAADVDAARPRLEQQILRERKPGPDRTVLETTSVRSRLANDPSRFGPYETVSETSYTRGTVQTIESTVGRRDINGRISAEEIRRDEKKVQK